ncbi:PREDICTED: uncharacterized protein LOC104735134 [Camelina sativa]|uniref:Uncharacterized protein LOC104735134 n=1 Tax=Camelina sativa TaxID=90675 RepID=A0ABM0VA09_CAMSA|nr:PREDICTED: uncharacterized protein LOC104735134 [Camelina sativa]
MSPPTREQLYTFHAQDRKLFSKLVLKFSRSPAESLLVMATWFWLEDFFSQNILSTILALSDPVVVALANEAVSCFQCLDSDEQPNDLNQIPLTAELMSVDISLPIIYKYRYSAITGIKNFLTTVCSRIFSDILQRVLPSSSSYSFFTRLRHPLIIPGFPHPTFGSINVIADGENLFNNNLSFCSHGLWGWNSNCIATDNERTMFITFSRGFPVSQEEVKHFFTKNYGENCVEGVYMNEGKDNDNCPNNGQQQTLYAKLVLDSVATVDRILDGKKIQKFKYNGKHIWARKFSENRDG